jgi:hypothetical protein
MASSSQATASSHTHHKKRKHSAVAQASGSVHTDPNAIKVSVLDTSTAVGPAWGEYGVDFDAQSSEAEPYHCLLTLTVNFSAIRPSKSTPFKVYRRDQASDNSTDITKQQTCIAGETGDVEFFSFNKDMPDAKDDHYACQ